MHATDYTSIGPEITGRVAANIRRLAEEQCIALAHLADKAGVGRTTLWRLLDVNDRGASDPRIGTVGRLAWALGVDVMALVEAPHGVAGGR